MDSLNDPIPFEVLSTYTTDQLRAIQPGRILNSILISLDKRESEVEIFDFAFQRFLHVLPTYDFDAYIFIPILQQLLFLTEKAPAMNAEGIRSIIQLQTTLIQNVNAAFLRESRTTSIRGLKIFFDLCMRMLFAILKLLSTQESDIQLVAEPLHQLQKHTLIILSLDYVHIGKTAQDVEYLSQILCSLCDLGDDHIKCKAINTKAKAEFFKIYLKLVTLNAEPLSEFDKSLEWFGAFVKLLCDGIDLDLEPSETSNERGDRKSIPKAMKFNEFYLQVILSLAETFSGDLFRGHVHFLRTYASVREALRNANQESDLKGHLLKLCERCNKIWDHFFASSQFAKALYDWLDNTGNIDNGSSDICFDLIGKIASSNHDEIENAFFRRNKYNIFNQMLRIYTPKAEGLIMNNKMVYGMIIRDLQTILLLAANKYCDGFKEIESILVDSVLQRNALIARISIEMWTLISRICDETAALQYISFWSAIAAESERIQGVHHIGIFIRKILDQLSSKNPKNIELSQEIVSVMNSLFHASIDLKHKCETNRNIDIRQHAAKVEKIISNLTAVLSLAKEQN